MIWLLYTFSSILTTLILKKIFRLSFLISLIILVTFLTPTYLSLDPIILTPSVFTFFFDLLFERNISFRHLRPLALSIPIFLVTYLILNWVRKKFS